MKRFTTYLSLMTMVLSMGITSVFAATGGGGGDESQAPACEQTDTCIVYVNDVMVSNEDGSKTEPFRTLGAAIDHVKSNQDYNTIRVAGGNYNETQANTYSSMSKGINIIGGYDESFIAQDSEVYPSVVDAADLTFLTISNSPGSLVGLTVKNANVAVSISNVSGNSFKFDVKNNVFMNNYKSSTPGASALGMSVEGANNSLVEGNTFYQNDSPQDTVASFNGGVDNLTVRNNVFHQNNTETIMYCEDAKAYNNYFLKNVAQNVVIASESNCEFYNNTVNGNAATVATIRAVGTGNDLANNLVTNNTGGISYVHAGGTEGQFRYNGLFGNATDPGLIQADQNMFCDPIYANTSGNTPDDMKLSPDSDCVDSAAILGDVTVDYYGTSRPAEGNGLGSVAVYDHGAYEAPDLSLDMAGIAGLDISEKTISPNGDNYKDKTTLSFVTSEKAKVTVQFEYNNMKQSAYENEKQTAGYVSFIWEGKDDSNNVVADGVYTFTVTTSNTGGTNSQTVDVTVDSTMVKPAEEEVTPEVDDEVVVEVEVEAEAEVKTPQETKEIETALAILASADSDGEKCEDYEDVSADHSDCEALTFVKENGAMTGNPDGTFAPAQPLQRDQIAKIILVALGQFDENEDYCLGVNPFPDVTSADWSYQYICRAVELGLITGYKSGADAGKYIPARAVNRAEALALLLRHIENLPGIDSTSFADVSSGQWFSGYAKYAQDNGLFGGSNLFAAESTIRIEVAEILFKLNAMGKLEATQ